MDSWCEPEEYLKAKRKHTELNLTSPGQIVKSEFYLTLY